jgi:hypothetical protein
MSMHGARRELRRLREKLRAADGEFRAAAPPVDAHGLPSWDGSDLSLEGYAKALDGDIPDADLSDEELETRRRLAPFASVFARLEETEKEDVT